MITNHLKPTRGTAVFPEVKTNCGFTLVEVMVASALVLLLFTTLFKTISFCNKSSSNIKWRLAADAIAFDEAWLIFNRQTEWFDTTITAAQAEWVRLDADRTSVWYGDKGAYLFRSITPHGIPASNWVIRTSLQWPVAHGGFEQLPSDYEIVRHRCDRRVF